MESSHLTQSRNVERIVNAGKKEPPAERDGWHQVIPRQRAAITQSSGFTATDSPITSIFGGKLRSELRIPGAKDSVTLEPYQSLQLDIGSPHVRSIVDALKGLTRQETLNGDFTSSRGSRVTAKKQVFVETFPPILILHLKRFQYDNAGGTQKIWKKISYPLDLVLPEEISPRHNRIRVNSHGSINTYRLTGVIYHHGKSASGGHYTVDVRHPNGQWWLRLDDTSIRAIQTDTVAMEGMDDEISSSNSNQAASEHQVGASDQLSRPPDENAERRRGLGTAHVGHAQHVLASQRSLSTKASNVHSDASRWRETGDRALTRDSKVAYLLFYSKSD